LGTNSSVKTRNEPNSNSLRQTRLSAWRRQKRRTTVEIQTTDSRGSAKHKSFCDTWSRRWSALRKIHSNFLSPASITFQSPPCRILPGKHDVSHPGSEPLIVSAIEIRREKGLRPWAFTEGLELSQVIVRNVQRKTIYPRWLRAQGQMTCTRFSEKAGPVRGDSRQTIRGEGNGTEGSLR
jgi:hypothetical protein